MSGRKLMRGPADIRFIGPKDDEVFAKWKPKHSP